MGFDFELFKNGVPRERRGASKKKEKKQEVEVVPASQTSISELPTVQEEPAATAEAEAESQEVPTPDEDGQMEVVELTDAEAAEELAGKVDFQPAYTWLEQPIEPLFYRSEGIVKVLYRHGNRAIVGPVPMQAFIKLATPIASA